jgi:hypothetical protein
MQRLKLTACSFGYNGLAVSRSDLLWIIARLEPGINGETQRFTDKVEHALVPSNDGGKWWKFLPSDGFNDGSDPYD